MRRRRHRRGLGEYPELATLGKGKGELEFHGKKYVCYGYPLKKAGRFMKPEDMDQIKCVRSEYAVVLSDDQIKAMKEKLAARDLRGRQYQEWQKIQGQASKAWYQGQAAGFPRPISTYRGFSPSEVERAIKAGAALEFDPRLWPPAKGSGKKSRKRRAA